MKRISPVIVALFVTGTCLLFADLSCGTEDQCSCRNGDYIEFPCEADGEGEVSRSVVCGSCEATCGKDGACRGPGIMDCLTCGPRELAGKMVETYLWREGPEDPGACKGRSKDPGCNMAGSAGKCRPCTSCRSGEFTKSICTSQKDTVCQEKTKLPPPRFLPYNMNEGDQATQVGIVVSLEDMEDKGSLDQVFLQYVIVEYPDWSTTPSAPSCDRRENGSSGTLLSAFVNTSKPVQVVAVTCPATMDGPWLPSDPVNREIKMKVPCTCERGAYVKRKCDVETGTAVQCGSCVVFCGNGGACVGPAPDHCLSCGIPLVGEDSARTNTVPGLMSFVPSEALSDSSEETLGTCHLCPLSCGQGSFMAEPCTADAKPTCRQCSTCPGNSRVLLPCDPASSYDTVCVSKAGSPPAEPSLSPGVPILLPEEGDGKVDVRLSSAPGTFLLYSVSEQAQEWMQAACYLESLRTEHGIKSSKDRGRSDRALNSVSLRVNEGRVTLIAVACPDTDSDNKMRKDPPSSVTVREIVALRSYKESNVNGSQAAVNGAVEISLGPADSSTLSADGLVKRFHSLFDLALQSYDVGTPVLALRWYVNGGSEKGGQESALGTDENERPRKLLFRVSSSPSTSKTITENNSKKGSVEISFSVFTKVIYVRKIMQLINQQLQPQGGIGLALSIDQLEMQQISIPSAMCPDEETRPCAYSEGAFSSCQLSDNIDHLHISDIEQEIKCTKKMEQVIARAAGLCAEPCNPLLLVTVPCPECECDMTGCIAPLDSSTSVGTKAASRLQQKQYDSAIAHQTSIVAMQEESGSQAWMAAVAFICCSIGIVLIWVAVGIYTNKRWRQNPGSCTDASGCSESASPEGYPDNQSVFHNPAFSTSDVGASSSSGVGAPSSSGGGASARSIRSIGGSVSSAIIFLPFTKKSPQGQSSDEQMMLFLSAISGGRSSNIAHNDGA